MTSTPAAAPEGAAEPSGGGSHVPRHVAIIMDGNGRWAERHGLPRVAGHRAGADAVRRCLQSAADHGVEVLTLYAFSSENWRRSSEEISDLTGLMRFYLDRELQALQREGVRIKLIGDYSAFGAEMAAKLERALEATANNLRLTLVVALNYGARAELTQATQRLARQAAEGTVDWRDIDQQAIEAELQTRDLPALDLLIRTSGEMRLSNFLLWQAAYAELYFSPVLWPDFDEAAFAAALESFASRQRRFGGR